MMSFFTGGTPKKEQKPKGKPASGGKKKAGHNEEDEWYLGNHTCMHKFTSGAVKPPGLLSASGGLLPPYAICVGDRRRAKAIGEMMDFESVVDLGLCAGDPGRVALFAGTYKGTPIVVWEHQMGTAACEIITKEMLAPDVMTTKFKTPDGETYSADSRYCIRVGSCGAVNGLHAKPLLKVYDLIVSNRSVGLSGTSYQKLTGALSFHEMQPGLGAKMKSMGYKFDKGMPVQQPDKELFTSLHDNCTKQLAKQQALGKAVLLGSQSKDSLYAESQPDVFVNLRDEYMVGCTEMEFEVIQRIANEYTKKGCPVKAGMVCYAVGVIPGGSFETLIPDEIKRSKTAAVMGALETLHQIAEGHRKENWYL